MTTRTLKDTAVDFLKQIVAGDVRGAYDIFRFEGGRIVELWDVAMVVPEKIVNENGMF
jgi:predicted SnoaL-like aldol condensation-catalyzing enzyme